MQTVAISWFVYRLTNSVFILGAVAFCSQIPSFFITPFAGVFIDRANKHKMLVVTQTLSMLQAFALFLLAFSNLKLVWLVIALSLFLGLVNSFDIPARQSFIVEMVERKQDLGNAIALNSLMFNAARLIGPSIAGILIGTIGEAGCFFINALSFLAVIAALLAMKIPHRKKEKHTHILEDLKEGFHYAFGVLPIRFILILLSVMSLVGMSYAVLMPVFAKQILGGGPHTFGFLMAAIGLGALCGTLYLASRKSILGLVKIIAFSMAVFGCGLILFSLSRALWLSLSILFITGFAMMVQMASSNTIIQSIIEDDKRGRVMSFYAMSFIGTAPFGSLIAGSLGAKIGAPLTVALGGGCCFVAALVFAFKIPVFRKEIHPIYVKMGIFPPAS
jgi:MFS family permease